MKKQMILFVKDYSFHFDGDPACIPEWRAAGLEVYQAENSIPELVASIGLAGVWCVVQDFLNFKWWPK